MMQPKFGEVKGIGDDVLKAVAVCLLLAGIPLCLILLAALLFLA